MLMKDKKKSLATLIVGSMKKGESELPAEASEPVEQDDSIAKESAAQDLLSSIEQKDVKGIVNAFSALMELCEYSEPEAPAEQA